MRFFNPGLDADEVGRVLDIGTGGGCIAIACAKSVSRPPGSMRWTSMARRSPSPKRTFATTVLEERVRLVESDLFSGIDGVYDLVHRQTRLTSGRSEYESLPAEYRHEPARGLCAGEDGVDVIARILEPASAYLQDEGLLVVEAGSCRPALEARYPDLPFTWLELERGGENVFLLRRESFSRKF